MKGAHNLEAKSRVDEYMIESGARHVCTQHDRGQQVYPGHWGFRFYYRPGFPELRGQTLQ